MTPNEVKDLMRLTREILNQATQAWRGNSHAFDLDARDDAIRMLDDLVKMKHMSGALKATRTERQKAKARNKG